MDEKTTRKKQSGTSPKDPVLQYALDVVEGREIAGPLVRAACQRHIRDLEEGEKRAGIWWDLAAANHVCGFFHDVLRLAGGEFEGKPFHLHASQQFIIGSIFGWKNDEGVRRFRTAYIEEGKGNGKSPLAGGVGLYMATADKEPRAEVYFAAVDKDQAKVPFHDAAAMVQQSPVLASRIKFSGGIDGDIKKVWNMAHLASGSFLRPISSETTGRGKSGFRPHCVILDEIHEHPSAAMIEFTSKNIKGRKQGLVFMITNSGVYGTVCWNYHTYAQKILEWQEPDEEFFAYVCGLDKDDDWKNPAVWKKANPLLGVSIPRRYLEKEVRESVGMPSKQSITRRLNFCEWVESEDPFIDPELWRQNGQPVCYEELKGQRCYAGLDLSNKNDLSALVLIFENGSVLPLFWTPQETVRIREDRDQVPYSQWIREGFLSAVPGKTIDYAYIAQRIGELTRDFDLQSIAFDPWHIDDMIKALDAENVDVDLVKHPQGFNGMSQSIQALEDYLLDGTLKHGNHPVLTSNIYCVKVDKDPAGNRKFTKRKSTGRIDGAVALAMACGLAKASKPKEVEFQAFIL